MACWGNLNAVLYLENILIVVNIISCHNSLDADEERIYKWKMLMWENYPKHRAMQMTKIIKQDIIRKKRVNWESSTVYNMGDNRKIRENMFRNNE